MESLAGALVLVLCMSLVDVSHAGYACDFESDDCGYMQDSTADFDWVRNNGTTLTEDTGPDVDHTTGTTLGFYMYAEASLPQQKGHKARIISPVESASTEQCVQFYYFMLGDHMGSVRVYARANTSSAFGSPLWEKSKEQGKQWYRGLATVPKMGSDQFAEIIFEAEIGSGVRSDMAIDDIEVYNSNGACPLDTFNCDFEKGWCGIKQDTKDNFNFVRKRGRTSSTDTGPSKDHTTGNGYYVYIEASGQTVNKKARIITPLFRGVQSNDNETFCVVFFYHMYGETVGELSVYLRNDTSTQLGDPIWWISGNRGDLWRGAEAQITTTRDFNLYFEAARGRSYTSDIALDDITITSYGCPGHHIVNDKTSVSCDFEQATLCHYEQDKTDNFDWSWRNRGTKDGFTGPSIDHTLGNELGFFVFITSTYRLTPADKARLISPVVKSNPKSSCVVFWYHMFGDDVEKMTVYIMNDGSKPPGNNAVWTLSKDQGNYWHYANFKIPANSPNVRIVFEASPGQKARDDIAIDDVELFEGQDCPPFTTLPPPSTTMPPVVSDISCDFETDYCGYINMKENDDMDWSRVSGKGASSVTYTGPTVDHTLGTAAGYYLSFDPRPIVGATLNDNAIMISPLLVASGQTRCLSLYAYMYGYSVDFLSIYTRNWGGTRSMDPNTFAYGNRGKFWFEIQLELPPSSEPFQVLLEAVCGRSRYSSEIAVDDISILHGGCESVTEKPIPWGVDCDFEQDGTLCGYTNYARAKVDWIRHSGSTPTDQTGPRFDHTRGTEQGHYLYIESSFPQRPKSDASLVSPSMNSQFDDLCLRFYYHVFGDDTGSLSVKLQSVVTSDEVLLFSIGGNHGDEWLPANINIPSRIVGGSDFQIKFEGRTGMGYLSDIAIDDIKFLRQPCEGLPSEGVCTFEQGFDYCGYDVDRSADLVWRWYDVLAVEDPPVNDINSVASSFAYIRGSPQTQNKKSVLFSNTYDLLGMTHCFTADVILSDDSQQQLVIEAQEVSTQRIVSLATLSGNMGPTWRRGNWTLGFDSFQSSFRLKFTATRGSQGVIAIDNAIITKQLDSCAEYIPLPTQPRTMATTGGDIRTQQPTTSFTAASTTDDTGVEIRRMSTGAIVGIALGAVVAIIAGVVIGCFVFRRQSTFSGKGIFNISYKKDVDEIPFSGEKPNNLATETGFANPVVFNAPTMQGSTA